jgi:hypothetical protein
MFTSLRPNGPLRAMARHEPGCAEHQAISHRQGVPPRPACCGQGKDEGILSVSSNKAHLLSPELTHWRN